MSRYRDQERLDQWRSNAEAQREADAKARRDAQDRAAALRSHNLTMLRAPAIDDIVVLGGIKPQYATVTKVWSDYQAAQSQSYFGRVGVITVRLGDYVSGETPKPNLWGDPPPATAITCWGTGERKWGYAAGIATDGAGQK